MDFGVDVPPQLVTQFVLEGLLASLSSVTLFLETTFISGPVTVNSPSPGTQEQD